METHSKYFFQDRKERLKEGSELILITDHFSTPENIGSVIRLAANIGAHKVLVVGSEDVRKSKVKKTAGAGIDHVQVDYCKEEELNVFVPDSFEWCVLETAEKAVSLYETSLPDKLALVVGNERYGVSQSLIAKADHLIYIPMTGQIKSMNVTHAATACAFEWLRQKL